MTDEEYMRRCLQLAEKGLGNVSPNPMVGAVIVHNNAIIGEGYHQQYGGPHAEVNAIASVKDQSQLSHSTMYVSLEPCCHYGKTPPCADLIIEKKIPEVVICNRDPFPAVDGKGIEKLQTVGVKVRYGVLNEQGRWLNRRFFTYHEQKRPYIFLKWAQTEDGYIDRLRKDVTDSPLKISSPESLIAMHKFRSYETAILVGPNTAIMDNPSLTVRYVDGKQPIRILLDRDLKVPQTSRLYDRSCLTYVITKQKPDVVIPNVEFLECTFYSDGRVDFPSFLSLLYDKKIESLIVEGGKLLLQSFIDEGIWDEIRLEINHSLVVGNGVKAPVLDEVRNTIHRYSYQIFDNNDVIYIRKS